MGEPARHARPMRPDEVAPGSAAPGTSASSDAPTRLLGPQVSLASRLSVALVACLLGLLVVGQLRGQAGVPGLSNLTATELTQLIANLTTSNDLLRAEIGELGRREATLAAAGDRGETAVDELDDDLARIRAWAGLTAVEDLFNELRNAGAEAIAVDGVRVVTGVVVAGAPGELSVENKALGDAFEIRAIGSSQILTGTLTRTGGVIAQVETAYPDATLTVTPVDRLTLPATERTLVPTDAEPRL
jgi:uncharacterized protein YlxW (UPF0749 family)